MQVLLAERAAVGDVLMRAEQHGRGSSAKPTNFHSQWNQRHAGCRARSRAQITTGCVRTASAAQAG